MSVVGFTPTNLAGWQVGFTTSNTAAIATNITNTLPVRTGLALWLDAADSATVITSGGSNVTQWNDKSGNGRNATQNTVSNQPSYQSNGIVYNSASIMYLSCYLDFLANTNHNAFIVNKISGNSNINFYKKVIFILKLFYFIISFIYFILENL